MKNYYRVVICLGVVFFLLLAAFIIYTGREDYSDEERGNVILALSDIAGDSSDNWTDLDALGNKDYGEEFVILGLENNLLYSSTGVTDADKVTLEEAIKRGYPYSYITKDSRVCGTVVVIYDGMREYRGLRYKMAAGLGIIGAVLIVAAVLYGQYVRKSIVTPFKNMQKFAGRVAEGNLDEPLMMEKNNMFGAFTESFDIMREELSESRKREIALQKKERELVASLSHDLKTPITGIKLTTELLKAKLEQADIGAGDEAVAEKLDNIYKKADQIDVLVSDLFSSTLDDLGEFKVNCCDEESKVLLDIVKKYDDRGLTVSSDIPEVIIHIDSKRMSQVIGNIISNSYKYADTRIDISYKIEQEFLEMKIQDYGPGVPEDELSLIANKFYRGKQWAESKEEGSGLGLYIAKMLMEKMNGEMLPESSGDGLTITLLIPIS